MESKNARMMKSRKTIHRVGQKVGGWELKEFLGGGGNGDVWRASRSDHSLDHAIKILRAMDATSYLRFRHEIAALSELNGIAGIIPLVESCIPETSKGNTAWYVMPVAQTFESYRERKTAHKLVKDFVELAETLEIIHNKHISHRDIKPANILYLDGKLCFSDFGLVKYPKREPITPKTRDVGAKFTMAPEMRRYASEADGLPADIYSFSKTLWIALTNQQLGFDGQYSVNSFLSLKNYLPKIYTTTLDQLLVECTDNDPLRRPKIRQVINRLNEWLTLLNDFHNRNLKEWTELQQLLFPHGSPSQAVWTDVDMICTVLGEIAKVPALNHMFYPTGGGNTITGVSRSAEPGMIRLHIGAKIAEVLRPMKLTFESFDVDPSWNYFRLEVAPVEPVGIKDAIGSEGIREELTEITPGNYVSYDHWNENEYLGEPLPDDARPVGRYLKGCFVFFSTRSVYNGDSSTYDARHNKMSEEEFRKYIERNAKQHARNNKHERRNP